MPPILPLLGQLITWIANNAKWLIPLLGLALFGLFCYREGSEHVQAQWDSSAAAQRKLTDEALERDRKAGELHSAALAAANAALRERVAKLNGRLDNEISKNTVYRDCIVPSDGVQILNGYRRGPYKGGAAGDAH